MRGTLQPFLPEPLKKLEPASPERDKPMDAPIAPTVETAQPVKTPPPLWRSFLVFLAPMMLSNVLQSLSGTINSVFLGQMIGVKAIAAATVFFPVMFFFISFVMGLGTGA